MKIPRLFFCVMSVPPLLNSFAEAQESLTVPAASARSVTQMQQVRSEKTVVLPGGRTLRVQHVTPPPVDAVPAPAAAPELSVEQRAARRAAWLAAAPLETRVLPLTAAVYPGGVTHLAWRLQGTDGVWQDMEAWSRMDFSALDAVSDLEVARVRYWFFNTVVDGRLPLAGKRTVPPLDSLPPPGEFRVVKGDSVDVSLTAPITALHADFLKNGAAYAALLQERRTAAEVERAAEAKLLTEDIVIKVWEKKPVRGNGGAK